jgi:hypothetical protein
MNQFAVTNSNVMYIHRYKYIHPSILGLSIAVTLSFLLGSIRHAVMDPIFFHKDRNLW